MKIEQIKEQLRNPSAIYRTAPLWVWNDAMTHGQIDKMLTELKIHGFGGAFVHPRPGMYLTYLDEAWFQAWDYALDKAKELGLLLYIYDENSYPTGFGGGHVSKELPDCLATSVSYEVKTREEIDFEKAGADRWMSDQSTVAVYACEKQEEQLVLLEDITMLPQKEWKELGSHFAFVTFVPPKAEGWMAGFANVDLLRPEVTELFLQKVYEPYYEHYKDDFGTQIPAIFMDEPSMPGSVVYGNAIADCLPISAWFGYEFCKIKGYDIMECIPALFGPATAAWFPYEAKKIRYDYYDVIHQLWTANFLIPITDWCTKHHIRSTGHFMEDGWPKPLYDVVSPSPMSNYEFQDWPGIDLLLTGRLKEQASEAQYISILEIQSAAHQFGKERVFCEAFGAGGWDSDLMDYKRMGDYLFVNGINFINEHLSYTSMTGARKRDHPQSFDWRQPWWNTYTELNNYFGRLSAVLSQGEARDRILILNPTMTGYLTAKDNDTSQLVYNRLCQTPDMRPFLQMIQELKRRQWDISLGDEIIMERHAQVKEGKLQIVRQTYEYIILQQSIENIRESTAKLLHEYMEQGGSLLCLGTPGTRMNGADGEEADETWNGLLIHPNAIRFSTIENLDLYLSAHLTPNIHLSRPLPEGVESYRRGLGEGEELYFIANHSQTDIQEPIAFTGQTIEIWDPWTGSIRDAEWTQSSNHLTTTLILKQNQSILYYISSKSKPGCETAAENPTKPGIRLEIGNPQKSECSLEEENTAKSEARIFGEHKRTMLSLDLIRPIKLNSYPIEYCDLTIDGRLFENMNTIYATECLFKKRGFPGNPWDNIVQFKNRTLDCNRYYNASSGYEIEYHFNIDPQAIPDQVLAAVEQANKYTLWINDHQQPLDITEYYLDETIRQADITSYLIPGCNTIKLAAVSFDVQQEIEPIYLRGNFAVNQTPDTWILSKPAPLTLGDWTSQGYPFYEGAMQYQFNWTWTPHQSHTQTTAPPESVFLQLPTPKATSMTLQVNNHTPELIGLDNRQEIDLTPYSQPGPNHLTLTLTPSLKNLLGPHYDPDKPRNSAWPNMWKHAPRTQCPPPSACDLIPYGLQEPLQLNKRVAASIQTPLQSD